MKYIQKNLKTSNFTRFMRSIFIIFYFIYCRIVFLGDTCDFCNCECCDNCFNGDEKSVKEGNSEKINEEEGNKKEEENEVNENLDIYALDTVTEKKYLIQVSENTKAARLKEKLIGILNTTNFEIRFKSKLYEGNQILKFEDGDTVYISPKDLGKRFSELLEKRFYREIYKNPYSFYETCKKSFLVVGVEGNLEEAKGEMKVKTEECIKNFFNGIELINKEDFNNYEKIKLLATFFLSNEDYDNYVNKCVEEEKENWQKTIVEKSKVNKILKGDKNFVTLLSDYVRTNGFNKNSENYHKEIDEISSNLLKCKPYVGTTYCGTRLYNENRYPLKISKSEKSKTIKAFIEKIKTGILKMESITSFSSDMGVAGHFAAFIKNAKEAFNFVICNHINKTGVNIYEDCDDSIFECGLKEEKEILYPKDSEFKILGIHIKRLKTFGEGDILGSKMTLVNGAVIDSNPEEFKFDYPFLVIDVIQIK